MERHGELGFGGALVDVGVWPRGIIWWWHGKGALYEGFIDTRLTQVAATLLDGVGHVHGKGWCCGRCLRCGHLLGHGVDDEDVRFAWWAFSRVTWALSSFDVASPLVLCTKCGHGGYLVLGQCYFGGGELSNVSVAGVECHLCRFSGDIGVGTGLDNNTGVVFSFGGRGGAATAGSK